MLKHILSTILVLNLGLLVVLGAVADGGPAVEAKAGDPMTGDKPATVSLQTDSALQKTIGQVLSDDEKAPTLRLTVTGLTVPKHRDVGIRVYLNKPDADGKTGIQNKHYVGSFTLLGDMEKDTPKTVFLDLTKTIRKFRNDRDFQPDKPLQITLVPTPIQAEVKLDAVTIPFTSVKISAHGK